MFKLPTLLALFICLVYSSNEHNVEQSPLRETQISQQQGKGNENNFQTTKAQYIEEKQKTKTCKGKKNRRLDANDNKDRDLFESLPLTATLEQTNTTTIGNNIVTSSVRGANYSYKNEYVESVNTDLPPKNCDCDNCVLETNRKVIEFETLALGSSPLSNPDIDVIINKSHDGGKKFELTDSSNTPFNKEAADESVSDDISSSPRDNLPLNLNTGELKKPCIKEFNLNTRRTKCNKVHLTEISPTTLTTRRIIPGIIENPTSQELEENKLYQKGPQVNNNDKKKPRQNWNGKLASSGQIENQHLEEDKLYQDDPQSNREGEPEMESRHNIFPNVQKVSNSYGIDLVHNMNINEVIPSSVEEDSIESQLTEPTRGKGIYDMKDTGVMLLENARVCYACSSMSDPTCWNPDRRTTVKYCKKGHHSCLTKSFKHRGKAVIIRDCGSHCVNLPGGEESYSSCSICHSDLCNGASSINIYSTSFAIIISFVVFFNTR